MSEFTKTLIVSNMIKSPTFSDGSSWTCENGWGITNSKARCVITASPARISQSGFSLLAGTYKIRYSVVPEAGETLSGTLYFRTYLGVNMVNSFELQNTAESWETPVLLTGVADKIGFVLEGAVGSYTRLDSVSMVYDDQFTTIKQAVVALGAGGGSVIVEASTYLLNGQDNQTTIDVPSNCAISGNGNVIITVDSQIPVFRNSNQSGWNERIGISGFKIVLNLGGLSYQHNPIFMKKIKYCIFENITIKNDSASFVDDRAAIWIEGVSDGDCLGNIVSNCNISNSSSGSARFPFGIYLMGYSKENMLVNNAIDNCINHGIYLNQSPKNVLSGNVVTNCDGCGIKLSASDYNALSDNQISENSTFGIHLFQSNNCSVQANVCSSNDFEGILVQGDSSSSMSNCNVISGNICNDNGKSGAMQNQKPGIRIGSFAKYNNVNGNNCSGNDLNGIMEESDSNTANNLYVGNMCYDNGGDELNVTGLTSIVANNMAE